MRDWPLPDPRPVAKVITVGTAGMVRDRSPLPRSFGSVAPTVAWAEVAGAVGTVIEVPRGPGRDRLPTAGARHEASGHKRGKPAPLRLMSSSIAALRRTRSRRAQEKPSGLPNLASCRCRRGIADWAWGQGGLLSKKAGTRGGLSAREVIAPATSAEDQGSARTTCSPGRRRSGPQPAAAH